MVAGCGLVTLNDAVLKWLLADLPVGELICLRALLVLPIVPLLARRDGGIAALRVHAWGGQVLCGVLLLIPVYLFLLAIRTLPLADAIALLFAGPLFSTALAVPMLGERVGWRRWSAVAVGFAGVLVIVRPAGDAFTWVALLPLGAAVASAIRDPVTRRLCKSETSSAILLVTTLVTAAGGAATAPFGWTAPGAAQVGLIALAALLLAVAQYLMTEALRAAEVGFVAPFRYTSIVFAGIYGFAIFGDLPDGWVVTGSAIVVASGIYILYREAALRRQTLAGG